MTLYSGKCEGGPLHGKVLHHGYPVYQSAMMWTKTVTRSQDAKKMLKEEGMKWFTYQYKNGRWICKT